MSETKTRPIIFSGEMVRALLRDENPKTMTRRVMKPQPSYMCDDWSHHAEAGDKVMYRGWPHYLRESRGRNKAAIGELAPERVRCPYGKPGDLLYVKETWRYDPVPGHYGGIPLEDRRRVLYRDDPNWGGVCSLLQLSGPLRRVRSARFMPKWASRIMLEITDIRVERLQEISPADAMAEGVEPITPGQLTASSLNEYVYGFLILWDSINRKRHPWSANDWLWVISFKPATEVSDADQDRVD